MCANITSVKLEIHRIFLTYRNFEEKPIKMIYYNKTIIKVCDVASIHDTQSFPDVPIP
jgi:hypothetical protein